MTDIVERLRSVDLTGYAEREYAHLIQEAADEIEQLREQVATLQATSGYEASIAQVEIERLRAVLRPMIEHFNIGGGKTPIGKMLEDARRALEPKP